MSLAFAIVHWSGGYERDRNAAICCRHNHQLFQRMQSCVVDYDYCVYDFSPMRLITGAHSCHLPRPTRFGKAAKVNDVIRRAMGVTDFLAISDSDTIIPEHHWFNLATMLCSGLRADTFYTFPTQDIVNEYMLDEAQLELRTDVLPSLQPRKDQTVCGGIFIAPVKALAAVGGMDERFKEWGCEDIDLQLRLQRYGLRREQQAITAWHLPHPPDPTRDPMKYAEQRVMALTDTGYYVRNGGALTARSGGHQDYSFLWNSRSVKSGNIDK